MDTLESKTEVSDLEGNIPVRSERPSTSTERLDGQWMFNTTSKTLEIHDGNVWRGAVMTTTSTSTTTT